MAEFVILGCTGSDAARWQSLFDQIPAEYQDILFTPAYAQVQENTGQGTCHAAVYVWQGFFILQPFMRKGSELTTFYGGAGPISNLIGKADYRLWLWFDLEFAKWREEQGITKEYVRLHPFFYKAQRRMLREATVNVEFLREAVVVNINKSDEELLKSFSRNRRRGVKEAQKAGVIVDQETDFESFSDLYSESMKRLQAEEYWDSQNWEWYERLGSQVTCLTARGDSAAILVLHSHGKAYAHFLAGTTWNDLLYYESMRRCRDLGCKSYFLGGGTTSDQNDPLLAYKSGFSTLRVPISFYNRDFEVPTHVDSSKTRPASLDIRT